LRTTSIEQVLNPTDIPETETLDPYHESYFWWINPANIVTIDAMAAIYQSQYGEDFTYQTPAQKSNSIWYTKYPVTKGNSSHYFEIPVV